MPRFIIGDLLTGQIRNTIPVTSGSWSDELNAAGSISCTVTLRDGIVRNRNLRNAAAVAKSFLAVVEGDTILQAGPIWVHDYDRDAQSLTITAAGMWSYFNHRVLLPVLAGRLPSDPSTDTNFASASLHDIAVALVAQAQAATNGNVPVIRPAGVAGTSTRKYAGSELGIVGARLTELTGVENGPDIHFAPRFTSDKKGVEWVMQVGTPTAPLISASTDVVFAISAAKSTTTAVKVNADGTGMAAQSLASGGSTGAVGLFAVANDTTLTTLGFPLLEVVDSSHQTVTELPTLQGYANENVLAGRRAKEIWSFDHNPTLGAPLVGAFNVGDFAAVRVHDDPYLDVGEYRMRIMKLSGTETGRKISIAFQPEVT